MTDRPEWFAPKRYGLGSGLPITWQGWAVTGGYSALIIAAVALLGDNPLALFSVAVPATVLLMVVAAKTTRGGWRWRWGRSDE